MTTKHISVSKLSEKQLCLLIAEEAGEIVQAATKIRHYVSSAPRRPDLIAP